MDTKVKVKIKDHGKKIAKVDNIFAKAQKKAIDINVSITKNMTSIDDTIKELEAQKDGMQKQLSHNEILVTNMSLILGDKELAVVKEIPGNAVESKIEKI